MRVSLPLSLLAIGWTGLVAAADTPIELKTDVKGQYFLLEKGGTSNNPTLLVKRVGPVGEHYIKRAFDCKARTVKYLGEGASLKEVSKPLSGQKMTPIVAESIPDQLSRLACPK